MKNIDILHNKIIFDEQILNEIINKLKLEKKRIIFTNGCFDILHKGHITYLAQAKDLGDILIIAINSDDSIKRLKGVDRPINKLEDRMFLLASLYFVDYVTFFNEDTPVEIIKKIKPDIHVKGGDYDIKTLPEKSVIESYGGEIVILPFVDGYSTTKLIYKMKQ